METIAVDIKDSVFDNDTEAMMYVTKDNDSYIIAIPVITFAWQLWKGHSERDYEWLKNSVPVGDPVRKEKLIEVIKHSVAEFE